MPNTAPKVSVVFNTFNEPDYIRPFFDSLYEQTLQPAEVICVDNSDRMNYAEEMKAMYPSLIVLRQNQNLDFCKGSNIGIQKAQYEYVLLLNQDMTVAATAIEEMVALLLCDERIGAVAPKLLRLVDGESAQPVIDSLGVAGDRSHRFWNIGEGEEDTAQFTEMNEPFGLSGAAVLFRKAALADIAQNGGGKPQEYFDEDFVAYKDDIDLSYRLRHRGWRLPIAQSAIVYHRRTAREIAGNQTVKEARRAKSFRIRGNSLRNHWWMLIKNEPFANLGLFSPWILWYECKKIVFVVLFEPSTLKILPSFFSGIPRILRKRRAILRTSQLTSQSLRRWFL